MCCFGPHHHRNHTFTVITHHTSMTRKRRRTANLGGLCSCRTYPLYSSREVTQVVQLAQMCCFGPRHHRNHTFTAVARHTSMTRKRRRTAYLVGLCSFRTYPLYSSREMTQVVQLAAQMCCFGPRHHRNHTFTAVTRRTSMTRKRSCTAYLVGLCSFRTYPLYSSREMTQVA